MPPEAGDGPRYEVRLSEPAEAEVEAAYLGRMRFGHAAADRWYAGFARALETLALFPNGFALAPESGTLGGNVRQMVYGKGNGAYRILYRVIEPEDGEPGVVRVQHVRHALQRQD